jgi:radical SAM superfamily enzyme YgiQ (UPF0313 family)
MANVMLVSFAGYPYAPSSLMPDNGLASLAGALADAGHAVRVLDYSTVSTLRRLFPERLGERVRPLAAALFRDGRRLSAAEKLRFLWAGLALDRHQRRETGAIAREVADQAARYGADVVGLKLWNGDGFAGSVRIAMALRERLPKAGIVGGGPQVDYFGRHILDYTDAFDVLVRGEGERVLPLLVDALIAGREWGDIPGLLWREGGGVRTTPVQTLSDLDQLPLPLYGRDVYPALDGDEKIKIGVVDESRGCPNRCSFCIHPIKSGGEWHLKSATRVTEEMQRLGEQLGTCYFVYSGSNTSAAVAVGIAQEIVAQGLHVRYGCFGHVRGIARADFDLLRRSGCEAIFYGLESGSPRILRDAFHKSLDLDTARRVLGDTRQAGICTIASIIYPAPFEDEQSRAETLAFLQEVRPDSVPVTIPGMIPGTPWEANPEQYGFAKSQRRDLWEYALTYKIKLLFPPSLWKPLPYRLNGKSSRTMFRECEGFIADLERCGLVTDVPHEMALMARALGLADDLKGFRNACRADFLCGDAERVGQMVRDINQSVRAAPSAPTPG